MNLDERIESAWKEQSSEARKWLQCSRESQLLRAAGFGFEEGYRAAMRSLFVDVKPEDVLSGVDYWAIVDGQWIPVWWFSDEYARTQAGDCETIVYVDIPPPEEIFGGTK